MRRREFITLVAGAAAGWPLAALAQQRERLRQVGMLLSGTADDAVFQALVGAFQQGLAQSGWIIGRNVRIETRWTGSKADDIRRHAQELAALAPDVILAHGGSTVRPLLQSTHSIPIVFTIVTDPVGNGYVESLARPGRNATGFMVNDYSLNAKYPELLKEIAPGISQVAVLRDASQGAGTGDFAVIQAMAPLLRMQANVIGLREAGEIESAVAAFARSPNGGLIMPGSAAGRHYRDLIISLAARHKLPAVYSERHFAAAGGLITYGANWIDQYRLAAGYVDRILKGEKASDLPVQAPTKYKLVINLKTAKALGLELPASVLLVVRLALKAKNREMSKQAMREESERLVKEALERKTLTVKQGKTRIDSKCRKCGAPNRVSAAQGQVRVPYTCKECGEKQRTF